MGLFTYVEVDKSLLPMDELTSVVDLSFQTKDLVRPIMGTIKIRKDGTVHYGNGASRKSLLDVKDNFDIWTIDDFRYLIVLEAIVEDGKVVKFELVDMKWGRDD